MANVQRPGDDRGVSTRREGHGKTQENAPRSPEKSPEKVSPVVSRVRSFLERHDLFGLKDFLKERGGEVATISSDTRFRAEKRVGQIRMYPKIWEIEQLNQHIEKLVAEENYLDALQLVEQNEKFLLESRVQSLLEKKHYHQARMLLDTYAAEKPPKKMSMGEIELESSIDAEIMSGVERIMESKDLKMRTRLDYRYERIWIMVHNGYYTQAADMCDQLNEEFYGPAKPLRKETPEQVELRHEEELLRALPSSLEEMKTVFPNLPELLNRFHHLAVIDKDDLPYLESLQGQFQLFAEKLFEQKKIVVQDTGVVRAEEQFLDLVDQMGDIGLHLYIDSRGTDNHLYLMSDEEVPEGYWPVDLKLLNENDIRIDLYNFEELNGQQAQEISGEKKISAPKYAWTSKTVSITPKKAEELRHAA